MIQEKQFNKKKKEFKNRKRKNYKSLKILFKIIFKQNLFKKRKKHKKK